MSNWLDNMERVMIDEPVYITTVDGKAVAETIMVKVEAMRDPETGEIYLDGKAVEQLDNAKARYMGVLLPTEIKALRLRLGLTQQEFSDLLGIGDRTCSRWENGRERPSQSLNKLLIALAEGRLNLGDLYAMKSPIFDWRQVAFSVSYQCAGKQTDFYYFNKTDGGWQ